MHSTLDDLEEFFADLDEEKHRSWTLHYNELLNSSFLENWERESLEELIRVNKFFDV